MGHIDALSKGQLKYLISLVYRFLHHMHGQLAGIFGEFLKIQVFRPDLANFFRKSARNKSRKRGSFLIATSIVPDSDDMPVGAGNQHFPHVPFLTVGFGKNSGTAIPDEFIVLVYIVNY